jgi:hypothetical protein
MKLTEHDLKQINNETLDRLPSHQVLSLTKTLLSDLKEAMDRLNQDSNNSSRPPSSTPPWFSKLLDPSEQDDDNLDHNDNQTNDGNDSPPNNNGSDNPPEEQNASDVQETPGPSPESISPSQKEKRKAGKQEGAEGFGRTQDLPVTEIVYHAATHCAVCLAPLTFLEPIPWTGFCSIEVAEHTADQIGLLFSVTKHLFCETECYCEHKNRVEPHTAIPDANWPKTALSEWRLVGPRFAAMIVMLSKRYRNSRRLIREFLLDFYGIQLSIGTIDQTILEAGRSVEPIEEEFIRELEAAVLAYIDETSWKEKGVLRWLWVFRTATLVLFMVGKRDRTIFSKLLLSGRFKGIVMSDGWVVYREYTNRLRCWAHLIRKARGLSESYNAEVAAIGLQILAFFNTFQSAIYRARDASEQVPLGTLTTQYANEMEQLTALCLAHQNSAHDKLRAFAREVLNDWDIIIRPIHDPSLPLTNNDAERILRHWVIDRRLSNGTRTAEGTRSFTLLASIIETCRIRGAPPWDYLTKLIMAARKGLQLPSLPLMQA